MESCLHTIFAEKPSNARVLLHKYIFAPAQNIDYLLAVSFSIMYFQLGHLPPLLPHVPLLDPAPFAPLL